MSNVFEDVKKYTDYYAMRWINTQSKQVRLIKINKSERKLKEKNLNQGLNKIFKLLDDIPIQQNDKAQWIREIKSEIKLMAKEHLKIEDPEFEKNMLDSIISVTEQFISQAKNFDSNISNIDIMQAMRNVWIMNLLQLVAGIKIEYTPSIFAYSMLYPYTDNYLDNSEISKKDKNEFNSRLTQRLKGEVVLPSNIQESKVFNLVEMIEKQYPRKDYKEVFESILSIQLGQVKSLQQQTDKLTNKDQVLKISAEKGGTSVLADAFLVCGNLGEELFEFAFGFGFLLQLIDDLQDMEKDRANNHFTLFSQSSRKQKADEDANKLISFLRTEIDYRKSAESLYFDKIKEMIIDNCTLMIFEAISANKKYFSRRYLNYVKERTALSFAFFNKANKKIQRKVKKYGDISMKTNVEMYSTTGI